MSEVVHFDEEFVPEVGFAGIIGIASQLAVERSGCTVAELMAHPKAAIAATADQVRILGQLNNDHPEQTWNGLTAAQVHEWFDDYRAQSDQS